MPSYPVQDWTDPSSTMPYVVIRGMQVMPAPVAVAVAAFQDPHHHPLPPAPQLDEEAGEQRTSCFGLSHYTATTYCCVTMLVSCMMTGLSVIGTCALLSNDEPSFACSPGIIMVSVLAWFSVYCALFFTCMIGMTMACNRCYPIPPIPPHAALPPPLPAPAE